MSITKFLKDVENNQKQVTEPNDVGGLTEEELKLMFDQAGMDIKDYLNNVLTEEVDTGEDITNNRKLSPTGDFSGTVNNQPLTTADPFLSSIVNSHIKQLSMNMNQDDGVTDNTATLNSIKLKSEKIFFPQNSLGNATYYFSGNPFYDGGLDTYTLSSDKDVILSISSINGVSLKNVIFDNKIKIYVRDRDNYALGYKKTDDFESIALTDNDIEVGFKAPQPLLMTDPLYIAENLNGNGSTDVGVYVDTEIGSTFANGYYINPAINATEDAGLYHALGIVSKPGMAFSIGFANGERETYENTRVGAVVWKDDKNFTVISLDLFNIYISNLNLDNSITWNESVNTIGLTSFSDAYKLTGRGFNMSIRHINSKEFEVYLNGVVIGTYKTNFAIQNIGVCMNHINPTGARGTNGILNWVMLNPMYESIEKGHIGHSLTGVAFGDSISETEGSAISWADFLPKLLKGQRGITSATMVNNAVSGENSTQQLARMQSFNFGAYNTCYILIGTNDIQQNVDIATFKNNIASMISLAKSNCYKVIIGIPPIWTTRSLTGVGVETSNYDNGIKYRECIKYLARANNVFIAECDYDIGRVGADNTTDFLRDNLHPGTLGIVNISKSFARSTIRAYTKDCTIADSSVEVQIVNPIFLNGWTDFNTTYKTTITKKDGILTYSGTIKTPTIPLVQGQEVLTFPVGFKPAKGKMISAINTGDTQSILTFDLNSAGIMSVNAGGSLLTSTFISFEGTVEIQ